MAGRATYQSPTDLDRPMRTIRRVIGRYVHWSYDSLCYCVYVEAAVCISLYWAPSLVTVWLSHCGTVSCESQKIVRWPTLSCMTSIVTTDNITAALDPE